MTDPIDFDALWDYNQPEVTEQKFREILNTSLDADSNYLLQLLTQIARTQGLQKRFDEAHQTLDGVEGQLPACNDLTKIRYSLERGRVFNSSSVPEKGRPLFLEAFELAQAANEDFYTVDAAHMMGIIEPPDQQLEWNLKAVKLAEAAESPKARNWLGSLYNNIGWTYHDLKRYDDALAIFVKALDFRKAQGKEDNIRVARWCIARTLRSLNRISEALTILQELEPGGDGYVYEELGECLLLTGESAQPYFAHAYDMLSKDVWLAAHEPERIKRLADLGQANASA